MPDPGTVVVAAGTIIAAALAAWATIWVGRRADRTNREAAAIAAAATAGETSITGWSELTKALELRVEKMQARITAVETEADETRGELKDTRDELKATRAQLERVEEDARLAARGLAAAVRFINQLIAIWPSHTVPIPDVPHELLQHGVDVPPPRIGERP
jgi:septal ring factor EnvC (AmiA/AmiB activator)